MSPKKLVSLGREEIRDLFNNAKDRRSGYYILKCYTPRVIKMNPKNLRQEKKKVWKGLYVISFFDFDRADDRNKVERVVIQYRYLDRRVIVSMTESREVISVGREKLVNTSFGEYWDDLDSPIYSPA